MASAPSGKLGKCTDHLQVDANTCALCYGTYKDDLLADCGEDWLQCTCGNWVHEECVEDCTADSNGDFAQIAEQFSLQPRVRNTYIQYTNVWWCTSNCKFHFISTAGHRILLAHNSWLRNVQRPMLRRAHGR